MPSEDYYAILGVQPGADTAQIKRAYRRLALECHPDRFPGDEAAAARFRRVSKAYNVLSDPERRAQYDSGGLTQELTDLAANPNLSSAKELFRSVVGDIFGNQKRERRRGRDVRYTLSLSLREAVLGCHKRIEFQAQVRCDDCEGRGFAAGGAPPVRCDLCEGRGQVRRAGLLSRKSPCGRCDGTGMLQRDACRVCHGRGSLQGRREFVVEIPPGTEAGAQRCMAGQGEPGRFGGEPGQLRVTIHVKPDPHLTRKGQDLVCELWVPPFWLALGRKASVPTIDGRATLQIPAGVQSGQSLRLRGLGVPDGSGRRGDLLVRVIAETPVALSEVQKQKLRALETLLGPENLPKSHEGAHDAAKPSPQPATSDA